MPNGRHLLYANRAGARLQLGDKRGAADDAATAAECGPPSFTTAYIRQARYVSGGPWLLARLATCCMWCRVHHQSRAGIELLVAEQVEALAALEDYVTASAVVDAAAERYPPFAKSAEWKSMRKQLDQVLK